MEMSLTCDSARTYMYMHVKIEKKHHGDEFSSYVIEGVLYLDPWFLPSDEMQEKRVVKTTSTPPQRNLKTEVLLRLKTHQMFNLRPHYARGI